MGFYPFAYAGVTPEEAMFEGWYNHRLDVIAESGIPAGKTIWMFDQTDMRAVKKKFGSWACFGGNVPVSLLKRARRRRCATT
jgi:hypothetical protein